VAGIRGSVIVDGAAIAYRRFGPLDGHPVLLVHGASAHQHWWDAMLSHRETAWSAITMDLSGHGESDHRGSYEPAVWAAEIADVIRATSTSGRATIIAHSMGGLISLAAAAKHPDVVERVVLLDIRVGPLQDATRHAPRGELGTRVRVHPDRASAVASFRLLPAGAELPMALTRALAEESFVRTPEGGWRVRFDPSTRGLITDHLIDGWLHEVRCEVVLLGGERTGNVRAEQAAYAAKALRAPVLWGNLPGAHHHLQVEDPEGTLAAFDDALHGTRASTVQWRVAEPGA
jgi:pimeloyl-ACP methyl ester carboxylesterase